ncbi:MAG: hypothetical protein A3F41_06880 [Coxiella sp. RIFCSPHIGHO2_12_FULL_44_14]|nr:MAG: hypothetical protein A3F41_06880 [Coxiella sp. RIFCSPHIGHO2_12_FULL_44_14]
MPKQDLNELSFAEKIFNLLKEKCEKDELISSELKQKPYRSHIYPDFFSQQPNEYNWKIVLDDNKQFLILGKSKEEAEQPPEKKRKLNQAALWNRESLYYQFYVEERGNIVLKEANGQKQSNSKLRYFLAEEVITEINKIRLFTIELLPDSTPPLRCHV